MLAGESWALRFKRRTYFQLFVLLSARVGCYEANFGYVIRAAKIVLSLIGRTGKVLLHWANSF